MEETYYTGTVCWFNKNYGFIEWRIGNIKQKDLFIHYSDIYCKGYKKLYKGQPVSFSIGRNKNDEPKAINVIVIK